MGSLLGYNGAIYENLVTDIFSKMGRYLCCFRKDSGMELDFVIRYCSECVPVEAKVHDGNTKSLKTLLRHPERCHAESAIKLADRNVGRVGAIPRIPRCMAFLLASS